MRDPRRLRSADGAPGRSASFRGGGLWIRPGQRPLAERRRRRLRQALIALALVAAVVAVRLWSQQNGAVVRARREVPCDAVFYYQGYAGWRDDRMGDSPRTLGEGGDEVCCLASLMAMREIPVPFPGALNPGTLNAWLSANGGYDGEGNLKWKDVAGLLGMTLVERRADRASAELLEELVKDGTYAVVRVKRADAAPTHEVLLVGSNHGEFTIVDPEDPSRALNTLGLYGNRIYGLRYLTRSEQT